jgi:adenylate cyclase
MGLLDRFGRGAKGPLAFICIGLIAAVITLLLFFIKPHFITIVDLKAGDAMLRARSVQSPTPEVVIVAIDEKSINELGRWPWKRSNIAKLIVGLREAEVTAFDMIFSESEDEANDAALSRAIKEADNVVLGYFFRDDSTEEPLAESLLQLERSAITVLRYIDGSDGLDVPALDFDGIETNIPSIGRGAEGFGSFNIVPGEDGVYRFSNLVFSYQGGLYPALSLEALRRFLDEDIIMSMAEYGIDEISIAEYPIVLNEAGHLALNFYGPGETFTHYSAVDVIEGRIDPDEFAGRIAFVGVTEKAVYDIRVTPVDPVYPGVEVHATVAANVLEGRFLISDMSTFLINAVMILFLPLIMAFLLSMVHRTYVSLIIFGVIASSLSAFVFFLFSTFDMVLTLVYPLISLSFAYVSLEAYRNVVVEKKSKFYRKAFSTYVPPQLVNEIIKDPESLKLGGQKRVISVLFSDIRGFTTISESMSPEKLVTLLNEYLTPMTQIVFDERGTLDKYIGDAVMAIYNAPVDLPMHPKRACTTALQMIAILPELNTGWQKRGFPPINIGIGINTGEAVVGNMGADIRFDYTAIGDTVNLSARLEGMTKLYGVKIIISEHTYRDTKEDFVFRDLDLVRVKGKTKPVAILELIDFKGAGTENSLALPFKEALINFRKGKFKTARRGFEDILKTFPDDGPCKLYIDRCDDYIASPPPADWDGVFTATTK